RPLLHEVGKVSGEARRMGCGKQECVVEGSLLWSRKPAGFEAAGHTPSGASRRLPQQAGCEAGEGDHAIARQQTGVLKTPYGMVEGAVPNTKRDQRPEMSCKNQNPVYYMI